MNKSIYLLTVLSLIIVTGCEKNLNESAIKLKHASNSQTEHVAVNHNTKPSQEQTLTQSDILQQIKQHLPASLHVKLPKQLPLSPNRFLSAATYSNKTMYRVIFFESKTIIPINDTKLNHSTFAHPIATLEVQTYKTEADARSTLNYLSPKEINTGNVPIQLGYGIKGYTDAGAGNLWLNWHEGRWYLTVHSSNIEGEKPEPLAKKMVTFLEKHTLPISHMYGTIQADSNPKKYKNNHVKWQEGKTIYTLSNVEDPFKMLSIATQFEDTAN